MADRHVEMQTAPPLALPNNTEIQVTPEYMVLVSTLLITGLKATPPTINASARLFNALARLIHELPRLIRTVRVSRRKPKTPDKK